MQSNQLCRGMEFWYDLGPEMSQIKTPSGWTGWGVFMAIADYSQLAGAGPPTKM